MLTIDLPCVFDDVERVRVDVRPGFRVRRHERDGTVTKCYESCMLRVPHGHVGRLERAGAIRRKRRRS